MAKKFYKVIAVILVMVMVFNIPCMPVLAAEPVVEEEKNPVKDGIFLAVMVVLIAGLGVGAYLLMRSNKHNEEKARNQNKAKNRKK
jgi:heme/copper-type cytochrome/quinol oxidase subunit 2